jgi:hypothetical protein
VKQHIPFIARFDPCTDIISKEMAIELLGRELLTTCPSDIKDIRTTQVTTEITGRVKTTAIELKDGTEVYLGWKGKDGYILWD